MSGRQAGRASQCGGEKLGDRLVAVVARRPQACVGHCISEINNGLETDSKGLQCFIRDSGGPGFDGTFR